jgi:hypothetical protein
MVSPLTLSQQPDFSLCCANLAASADLYPAGFSDLPFNEVAEFVE